MEEQVPGLLWNMFSLHSNRVGNPDSCSREISEVHVHVEHACTRVLWKHIFYVVEGGAFGNDRTENTRVQHPAKGFDRCLCSFLEILELLLQAAGMASAGPSDPQDSPSTGFPWWHPLPSSFSACSSGSFS